MILTDFNGVAISAIVAAAFREKIPMERNMIKHIAITSFLNINKHLAREYGKHYLLVDSRSWRKDEFPFYKANRKDAKEKSSIDWDLIFSVMNELRDDFDQYFPFEILRHEGCEADDLIAALTKYAQAFEKVVIVSKDKDFHQLVNFSVSQYNPMTKKFFDVDPEAFRTEHILSGDSGDGVPNILSDDDAFISESKSQKKMTAKRKEILLRLAENEFQNVSLNDEKELKISAEILKRNWERNKRLIDLTELHECTKGFLREFETSNAEEKLPNDLLQYFVKNKMIVLMGKVNDFFIKKSEGKNETKVLNKKHSTKHNTNNTNSLKKFM
jgi:5'-3' exonuclease